MMVLVKIISLVSCFGFHGSLRPYFSLYRAVLHRDGNKRNMIVERKNVQPNPCAPTASTVGPNPTSIQISRKPRHLKLPSTIARPQPRPEQFHTFSFFNLISIFAVQVRFLSDADIVETVKWGSVA